MLWFYVPMLFLLKQCSILYNTELHVPPLESCTIIHICKDSQVFVDDKIFK